MSDLVLILTARFGARVKRDEPLSRHTSMGIGGPADAYAEPATADELRAVLDLVAERGVPLLMIGRGTNLLPDDRGFRGVALKLAGEFGRIEVGDGWVEAGAAAPLAALVERGMHRDLGGLEFTTGIPGAVGGSLAGNAGTASEALGDRVERVDVAAAGGLLRRLNAAECGFAYRTSALRSAGAVITAARFRLEPRSRIEVASRVRTYTDKRKSQPLTQPNVGCIFKNPAGDSAGRLIDAAGLKGARSGGVEVSARHANFMVNLGGATAADVRALIGVVRAGVRSAHGVALETEVVALDEWGRAAPAEAAAC